MALFDDSLVKDLAAKWKVVEKKDHVKTTSYFKKYEESFIDEVMAHVMGKPEGRPETRKDFMMKNLKFQCMNHADEIILPLFSFKCTNFGDSKTKTMNGKLKFKGEETYRDAAIRLGYHKLCKPIPYVKETGEDRAEQIKEDEAVEADGEGPERPAPFNYVYDFTDVRYKIAEKFGTNFTVIKKWRQTDNSEEGFGKPHIKTYQVTMFLKFYPEGIDDEDWLAKKPSIAPVEKVADVDEKVVDPEKKSTEKKSSKKYVDKV